MRFFISNYALFSGELRAKNPELCELHNIAQLFLTKLANLLWFYFLYKIIDFQNENTGKKVVLLNKSEQGDFFFSKL